MVTGDLMLRLIRLKSKGYCCAQIVVILALEAQGKTNPDLVRALGGLCFGINQSGEVCGALSGAACLISLYAGRGGDDDQPDRRHPAMMDELVDWFTEASAEYGGTRCDDILDRFPNHGICGRIVAESYGKCMEILTSHGIDPTIGKNG